MKRYLFLITVLMIPILLMAKGQRPVSLAAVTVADVVSAADTVLAVVRADTAYSSIVPIDQANCIQFYVVVIGDTAFSQDTNYVSVQLSHRLGAPVWVTYLDTHIVKMQSSDTAYSTFTLCFNEAAGVGLMGDQMRFVYSHRDSVGSGESWPQGLDGNTYNYVFTTTYKIYAD